MANIKAHHVIVPHFLAELLSVVSVRVVHVHGQVDWVFSPAQILGILLQTAQHKANEVVLSEYFIRVTSIDAHQPPLPRKTAVITFEVLIVFLTIRSTSSRDKADKGVFGIYNRPMTRPLSPGF
jgi:hypothetical protein